MRLPSWASCESRHRFFVCLSFVACVGAVFWLLPLKAWAAGIRINQADYVISDSPTLPDQTASWQTANLPHRSARPQDSELSSYWYRMKFEPDREADGLWLYFPKLRSGGEIYLNGVLLASIKDADRLTQRRWFRPFMFAAPNFLLNKGVNVISVHLHLKEPLTSFGEVVVDTEEKIRPDYEMLFFWEKTVSEVASILCIAAGAFMFLIWMRRRQEQFYGIFGICALFWGIRTIIFRMPEVPMNLWLLWRLLYYFTTAGFIVWITMFLIRFTEKRIPLVEKTMVAYWLTGCTVFAIVGAPARATMDSIWTLGFLPFTLFAVFLLVKYVISNRSVSAFAMFVAIILALCFALHDYAVQHGFWGLSEFYLLHLGIPAFLAVMGWGLLDRFLCNLELADSLNENLAIRLAQRESELLDAHEHLRVLEKTAAVAQERQRIIQNLHDGVGSQLLSSLLLVRSGHADVREVAVSLQECIDEMRLSLDTLALGDDNLLRLMANFRSRISARFHAIGLGFHWKMQDIPENLVLPSGVALDLLRILQEALTNVLKHARASQVVVSLSRAGDALLIVIADNGVGFSPGRQHDGYGLQNIRARAAKIGAAVDFLSGKHGTQVKVVLQLSTELIENGETTDKGDSARA